MNIEDLNVGDYVWAKMKGYPHWPGRIMDPPSDSKLKSKKSKYVFFFGSENYAWILNENIELHSEANLQKYGMKKGAPFLSALQTLIEKTKDDPKYHESLRSSRKHGIESVDEKNLDNAAMSASPSKIENPETSTAPKRMKKLPLKKVLPVKALTQKKKPVRKYNHAAETDPTSSSSSRLENADVSMPSVSYFTEDDIYVPPTRFELRNSKKYVERPRSPPIDLMYQSDFMRSKTIVPTKKKIGFLGLSKIGQAIVRNLYHSGHSIVIWNHTLNECKIFSDKFKLQIAKTPSEVVRAADITFCYMSDSEAAKEFFFKNTGILEEMERPTTVRKGIVELTSIDPKVSQYIANEIRIKGGRYLVAPICGSRKETDEGTLSIMAAGDKTLYDDCKSCLDAITKKNSFMSAEVGMASKLDIVHNMLIGTVYAAVAETLALVNVSGLNGDHFKDILEASAMDSTEVLGKASCMLNTDYKTDVTLKHISEQFNLGLALGDEVSQRTSIFATAKEVYKHCAAMNYGDHDVSAVFQATKQ